MSVTFMLHLSVAKYFTLWGVFCRVSQGLQNHLPFLNITKTLGKWLLSNQ